MSHERTSPPRYQPTWGQRFLSPAYFSHVTNTPIQTVAGRIQDLEDPIRDRHYTVTLTETHKQHIDFVVLVSRRHSETYARARPLCYIRGVIAASDDTQVVLEGIVHKPSELTQNSVVAVIMGIGGSLAWVMLGAAPSSAYATVLVVMTVIGLLYFLLWQAYIHFRYQWVRGHALEWAEKWAEASPQKHPD